jgi:two-component system, LytTR family, response regulator
MLHFFLIITVMLKAIIIDDDNRDEKILEILLHKYCAQEISLIGAAGNITAAYQLILESKPDLIFLDVELGNETGFDLLSKFTYYSFNVVFVTAYDKYAVRAIKFSALDYILKPVNLDELVKAVQKATKVESISIEKEIRNLLKTIARPGNKTNQIAIPTLNGFQLLPVEEIIYCEAKKEYTLIHCVDQTTLYSSINLGEYEDLLQEYSFLRVHHSYVVNKQHAKQYIKGEGGELLLRNNLQVPVSRRKKQEVVEWLTNSK